MNFRRFLLGCLLAWGAATGGLGIFATLRHSEAQAAPRLLTWGLDTSVSPANVCLYYTSAGCFNIGTMSAGGQFAMPIGNLPAMAPETMIANATQITAVPTAVQIPTSQPQGRLTLQSGVPVMTSPTTAATTVYYTPYTGNQIPIPDGAGTGGFINAVFSELSQATTDATKSPAPVAVNSCYDIFVWLDNVTPRATRGPAWTSCSTRGATAALVRYNGFLVNNLGITNGPAAKTGIRVGSISSNASSTIDYIFGGAGSGGVNARLQVCNAFNRQPVTTQVIDTGAGYTYSSATIRQARGAVTMQVSLIACDAADVAQVQYQTECLTTAGAGSGCDIGMGFDSTTTFSLPRMRAIAPTAAALTAGQMQASAWLPGLGVHVLSANESSVTGAANTFNNVGFGELTLTINH